LVIVLTRAPRLRLAGHGERLRLRLHDRGNPAPLETLHECCRASTAVDKALGEAVRGARAAGASWQDIGRALGATDNAQTQQEVVNAFADQKRTIWRRFWT
jgi:hypothetical protein